MTAHWPKVRALEALLAERLSPAGKRRLLAHLARCERCRAAQAAIARYAQGIAAARVLPVPELSFEELERRMGREPAPGARGRGPAWTLAALAAAACFALLWLRSAGTPSTQGSPRSARSAVQVDAGGSVHEQEPVATPQSPEPPERHGWLTAHAGAGASVEPHLLAGAQVQEGARLVTGAGEELHVFLEAGTGIVLWPESELVITRLRPGEIVLSLLRGRLSNSVHKLDPGASYDVMMGELRATVQGTRFLVAHAATASRVDVYEGRVRVRQGDLVLGELGPGQYWSNGAVAAGEDREIIGLDAASAAWPALMLPGLSSVSAWFVAGHRFEGALGELAFRAPAGDVKLEFADVRGKHHTLVYKLRAEGGLLTEALVQSALSAEREAVPGYLAPEEILPVVQQGLPALKRCYERSLRRAPALTARVRMTVRLLASGKVGRVTLTPVEGDLAGELESCLRAQAQTWVFPRPEGGAVTFDVPINLRAQNN